MIITYNFIYYNHINDINDTCYSWARNSFYKSTLHRLYSSRTCHIVVDSYYNNQCIKNLYISKINNKLSWEKKLDGIINIDIHLLILIFISMYRRRCKYRWWCNSYDAGVNDFKYYSQKNNLYRLNFANNYTLWTFWILYFFIITYCNILF